MAAARYAPNTLFRDARERLFESREALAAAANALLPAAFLMNANDIGKIERGIVTYPRVPRRAALRQVLGVDTDAEIGLFDTRTTSSVDRDRVGHDAGQPEDGPTDSHAPEWRPPDLADLSDRLDSVWRDGSNDMPLLGRRALLAGLATVAAAAGLGGPGGKPRRRIGISDISRLNAVTALYRSIDIEFGGGTLVKAVGEFAESVSEMIDHDIPERLRRSLFSAIASARYLAAWTAFDATRHFDAQRHFIAAERYALDSKDSRLIAHVRYGQAKQLQHLRHNRDALQALRLAYRDLDPTPGVLVVLGGAEAASRAAISDFEGAIRALDQASEAFTNVEQSSEPDWLGFLDEGELFAQYGRVYRDMARHDRRHGEKAVQWVHAAIESFGPQNQRSTVLNQVGLCSAYFLAGAPDLALQAGRTAQRHAATISSARIIDRISNLRRDAVDFEGDADVAEFVHALPFR